MNQRRYAGGRKWSPARFRALAEYIIARCEGKCLRCGGTGSWPAPTRQLCPDCKGKPGIPVKQVWAIMFFADFEAYRLLGRSITGATWRKAPWGVYPTHKGKAFTRRYEY